MPSAPTQRMTIAIKAATLARLIFAGKKSIARDIYHANKIEQKKCSTDMLVAGFCLGMLGTLGIIFLLYKASILPLGAMGTDARCGLHDKWAIGNGEACHISLQVIDPSSLREADWLEILKIYSREPAKATHAKSQPDSKALVLRYTQDTPNSALLALSNEEMASLAKAIKTFSKEKEAQRASEKKNASLEILLEAMESGADPKKSWMEAAAKIREMKEKLPPESQKISLPSRAFTITSGNMASLMRLYLGDKASREESAAAIFIQREEVSLTVDLGVLLAFAIGIIFTFLTIPAHDFLTAMAVQDHGLYLVREYFQLQKTPNSKRLKQKTMNRI